MREVGSMSDSKPCEVCEAPVPFSHAIFAHAIDPETGEVKWVCLSCRAKMIPADQCDACRQWKPRKGGQPVYAQDAAGDLQEVIWLCCDCAK